MGELYSATVMGNGGLPKIAMLVYAASPLRCVTVWRPIQCRWQARVSPRQPLCIYLLAPARAALPQSTKQALERAW
jgi:hypothetical protein